MKRNTLLLIALTAVIVMYCASNCVADGFPNTTFGLFSGVGDSQVEFNMFQGWFNGSRAWYICTDSNDFRFAQTHNLTYTPRLSSAINSGIPTIYLVTNLNQGPVFTAQPGVAPYAGLWQVVYITWQPGVIPRPICNANPESPTNPSGLPTTTEAFFSNVCNGTAIDPDGPWTIVDYPIIAIGPLGGPWLPAPPGTYRLPQVIDVEVRDKEVTLPTWFVYCQSPITEGVFVRSVIIPDIADPTLAAEVRANVAPGLSLVPSTDVQKFWVIDPNQIVAPGVCLPVAPSQLPVAERCPDDINACNTYFADDALNYTPVMDFTLLDRITCPVSTVFNNPDIVESAVQSGGLDITSTSLINAPFVEPCDITVWNRTIKFGLMDLVPDGDQIDVTLNGVPVVTNYKLTLIPKTWPLQFRPGDNLITVHADNVGSLLKYNTPILLFSDANIPIVPLVLKANETVSFVITSP